jgi:hypothetical protein
MNSKYAKNILLTFVCNVFVQFHLKGIILLFYNYIFDILTVWCCLFSFDYHSVIMLKTEVMSLLSCCRDISWIQIAMCQHIFYISQRSATHYVLWLVDSLRLHIYIYIYTCSHTTSLCYYVEN